VAQILCEEVLALPARDNIHRVGTFVVNRLFDCDVYGVENIPATGRLLMYYNHINILDPVLTCAAVPRDVYPVSKEENFNKPIVGYITREYGTISLRRGEVDTQAFKRSLDILKQEDVLLVAPEGTRSGHGRLQNGKDGPTLMALRSGAPLIPVGLVGQEHFRSRVRQLRKTPVSIRIGRPFRFVANGSGRVNRDDLRAMTTEAMRELAGLLPASNRGAYAEGIDEPRKWITYELEN